MEVYASIIKDATVHNLKHATIAVKYRVTKSLVHRIVKARKVSDDFLEVLEEKQARKEERIRRIQQAVSSMLQQNLHVWRTSLVKDMVHSEHGLAVPNNLIA